MYTTFTRGSWVMVLPINSSRRCESSLLEAGKEELLAEGPSSSELLSQINNRLYPRAGHNCVQKGVAKLAF